jgi:hypothetical protein
MKITKVLSLARAALAGAMMLTLVAPLQAQWDRQDNFFPNANDVTWLTTDGTILQDSSTPADAPLHNGFGGSYSA